MVVLNAPQQDHYVILQVHRDAEPEVIEAAYRSLMRRYHPDMAGDDHELAAMLHERAKSLNLAYAVLRDPRKRSDYDRLLSRQGGPDAAASANAASAAGERPASARPGERADAPSGDPTDGTRGWGRQARAGRMRQAAPRGPWTPALATLSSVYYFLPGPYEWERERDRDLLVTMILPPLGVAGWSLSSGRLALLTGHAPYVGWFAWALLAVLALPLWSSVPRLLLAGLPTALLLTGLAEGPLQLLGVPAAFAWLVAGVLGIVVSARLYLFAVLPTLVVCWVLSNASVGLSALGVALGGLGGLFSTTQLGVLTIASLVGVLTWLTLMTWERPSTPARAQSAVPEPPAVEADRPFFRFISADRVQALQPVPLRTDRDHSERPCALVAAHQEANLLFVSGGWAFVQTDDGLEGWAEWRVEP